MGVLVSASFLRPARALSLFSLLLCSALANASLVIVASVDKPFSLTKSEVKSIFMGGATSRNLTPIALTPDNRSRALFNAKVIGMTEARIQSYWAQMRFSGRQKPPREFDNEQAIIDYLVEHPSSVAYLDSNVELREGLFILYRTEE